MKYYYQIFLLLIAPFFLSGSNKKNSNLYLKLQNNFSETLNNVRAYTTAPALSIADTRVVEGNSGQKSVEVMLSLSQVSSNVVTVAYNTGNGTAAAGSDYAAVNGTVSFAKGEIIKRINVSVIGDLAVEADETFEIVLNNPSGATLTNGTGTVTIVNDDFRGGNLAVYEVRFTFTGYTTFFGTPSDCPIRPNGKVVMTGLLAGVENVGADDDIHYDGTLQMDMDIDICSVKANTDPAEFCGITVVGSGPMKTELEIYFDGRGGYMKTKNESGRFMKSASGSCDQAQIAEEFTMIPNKTIASVFNGTELPTLTNRTLQVGQYVERGEGTETVIEILRKVR